MKFILCLMAYMLSGCASYTPPTFYKATDAEIAAADIGSLPEDYQQLIKNHMQQILKDPESARYRFPKAPEKIAHLKTNPNEPFKFYWRINYFVNAKNSYGGYTGEHEYAADIKNGAVVEASNITKIRGDLDKYIRGD